jgi:hypothetical protein
MIEFIYLLFGSALTFLAILFLKMFHAETGIKESGDDLLYRNGKSEKYYSEGFTGRVQKVASKFQAVTTNSHNTYNNSFNTYHTSFGDVKVYILPALEYEKGNEFICSSGKEPAEYIDYEKKKSIEFEENPIDKFKKIPVPIEKKYENK